MQRNNNNLKDSILLLKLAKEQIKRHLKVKIVEKKISYSKSNKIIYFATVQRSASQWIKKLFDDSRIRKYSKLITYPQHSYENWVKILEFPLGSFVPCLYINYYDFKKIVKPNKYKVFFILRDPRDVVVSWYFAAKISHSPTPDGLVQWCHNRLNKLDQENGLIWSIKYLDTYGVFNIQKSWVEASIKGLEPNLKIFKYEDLIKDNFKYFKAIMRHCEIEVPDDIKKNVINDYKFDKLSHRKKPSENIYSHYRKGISEDFKNKFSKKVYNYFYKVTGDLISYLGY